jgi:hypothetical protein
MLEAPDTAIIADSMFDYPGDPQGWQYTHLDAVNRFGAFRAREDSRESATALAFLVCDDPDCIVGRDFLHPGYLARPCLQWNSEFGGRYVLHGEFALVEAAAAGGLHVVAEADDRRLLDQTVDFPRHLEFVIPIDVREGGFVRIVVACLGHINHNLCQFSLRIRRRPGNEAATLSENRPDTFRLAEPPAWDALRETLDALLPAGLPPAARDAILRQPFDGAALPVGARAAIGQHLHRQMFPRFHALYRREGFFAAAPPAGDA